MGLIDNLNDRSSELVRKCTYSSTRIYYDSTGDMQIDSCKRIIECSDIYIKIRSVDKFIEIWGCGLNISCMSRDSVYIGGRIDSIEFAPAGRRDNDE